MSGKQHGPGAQETRASIYEPQFPILREAATDPFPPTTGWPVGVGGGTHYQPVRDGSGVDHFLSIFVPGSRLSPASGYHLRLTGSRQGRGHSPVKGYRLGLSSDSGVRWSEPLTQSFAHPPSSSDPCRTELNNVQSTLTQTSTHTRPISVLALQSAGARQALLR